MASHVRYGGRVVEAVHRVLGKGAVTLGVGIRHPAEEDFGGVLHVAVLVHNDDILSEHHLAHPPEAVHDLEGLPRILLPNRNEDEVVECSLSR